MCSCLGLMDEYRGMVLIVDLTRGEIGAEEQQVTTIVNLIMIVLHSLRAHWSEELGFAECRQSTRRFIIHAALIPSTQTAQ